MKTVIITDGKYRSALAAARDLGRAGYRVLVTQTKADCASEPPVFASVFASGRWIEGGVGDPEYPDRLFELINFVNDQSSMRISTGMLNDVLADAQARVQPPTDKGRRLKIYYMTQTGVKPPNFVIFCNSRELFHFSYQRYIENQIRGVFGLEGTPVRIVIRQKGDKE